MKQELCKAFCDQLSVRQVPAGLAVSTAFGVPGGDKLGFYVIKDNASGLVTIQDSGTLFPSLQASGLDLKSPSRKAALQALLDEYHVEFDDEERDFRIASVQQSAVAAAALKFVSFLIRVGDLTLLDAERVSSTFHEDVAKQLQKVFKDTATVAENVPLLTRIQEFVPDFVLQAPGQPPVGLYLGTSDARVLEALFVYMRATHEVRQPCKVVGLLEKESAVSATVRSQATNRLNGLLHYRGHESDVMNRLRQEVLGTNGVIH